jgi:hypothetical protein
MGDLYVARVQVGTPALERWGALGGFAARPAVIAAMKAEGLLRKAALTSFEAPPRRLPTPSRSG